MPSNMQMLTTKNIAIKSRQIKCKRPFSRLRVFGTRTSPNPNRSSNQIYIFCLDIIRILNTKLRLIEHTTFAWKYPCKMIHETR